jgi:tRNA-modifying protein YgfZ
VLDINGAVEAEWPDEGVASHYGDPAREQRAMTEGQVLVDRANRGVIKVTGPDRLPWLHSLTSQHLERLAPGRTEEALVLSPQGHLEHHLTLTDDGTATWIHVEPHTAKSLVSYLDSMRFMSRVEVEDRSGTLAVLTLAGPLPAEGGILSRTGAGVAPPVMPDGDGAVAAVLDGPFGTDLIAAPDAAARLAAAYPVAGMWAFEAARIAARVPRPGLDTDHKTLPHEVGLIESAVHLNKGCYRGQETVARIHNLGHPPRRLVFLHLDGSVDRLPAHGAPLTLADGTQVGFVGSAARHFELGPIGLGLVKRSVDPAATLLADGIAAAQEVVVAPDAGANVKVTLRRDSVPQPPAGRRMLLSPGGDDPPYPPMSALADLIAKSAILSGPLRRTRAATFCEQS